VFSPCHPNHGKIKKKKKKKKKKQKKLH